MAYEFSFSVKCCSKLLHELIEQRHFDLGIEDFIFWGNFSHQQNSELAAQETMKCRAEEHIINVN